VGGLLGNSFILLRLRQGRSFRKVNNRRKRQCCALFGRKKAVHPFGQVLRGRSERVFQVKARREPFGRSSKERGRRGHAKAGWQLLVNLGAQPRGKGKKTRMLQGGGGRKDRGPN